MVDKKPIPKIKPEEPIEIGSDAFVVDMIAFGIIIVCIVVAIIVR